DANNERGSKGSPFQFLEQRRFVRLERNTSAQSGSIPDDIVGAVSFPFDSRGNFVGKLEVHLGTAFAPYFTLVCWCAWRPGGANSQAGSHDASRQDGSRADSNRLAASNRHLAVGDPAERWLDLGVAPHELCAEPCAALHCPNLTSAESRGAKVGLDVI